MAGRGIVIRIEGDGASAKAALEMVREQLAQTGEQGSRTADMMSESMERIKHSLEYVGIYMGIREAIDGLKEMVGGSVELGVELGHLHQQTGISTENLSVLKYMADSTGVSFDALTRGAKKFSTEIRNTDEGSKPAVQAFARIGISQETVRKTGGDMYAMLGLVADRFQKLPDGPLKAASAVDLFGKGGLALIPILNQGRAGIEGFRSEAESLGLVLDEQGIAKMEALHAATIKVEGALRGAGLGITEGLEPALLELEQAIASVTGSGDGFVTMGQHMGNILLGVANAAAYLVKFLRQAKDEWVALGQLGTADASKLDSMLGIGSASRSQYRADNTNALAGEKAALQDIKDAEADYQTFANKLAMGLDGGDQGVITLANGNKAMKRPKPGGTGTDDFDQQHQGGKGKSTDGVARAAEAYAAEQAKAAADARKAFDQEELAELESHHKQLLMSDQEFYAEKLKLQLDELDTEHDGLNSKYNDLAALQGKQHGDKTLKRDSTGTSAEEYNTQREMLAVGAQLTENEAKRNELKAAYNAQVTSGAAAAELANLRAAAALEVERGHGTAAQIALLQREHELEAQKVTREGGSAAAAQQIRDAGELAAKKLQITDINRQIEQSEEANRAAVQRLNDAAAKDPRLKKESTAEINALNRAEAQQLQQLVAAYDALAKELGGEYLAKSKELHAQLDEMNTPSNKGSAKIGEDVAQGVESMAERMARASESGKDSFHKMAQGIEEDITQLAIKLAFQKFLTPLLTGLFNGGAGGGVPQVPDSMFASMDLPGFASGGDPTGPSIVGEQGPELFMPKGPGTIVPSSLTTQLAKSGGGGAPNITQNIINQSSQPVTAQPPQVNYDEEGRSWISHTVLTDLAQGGPISQAFRQSS